MEILHLLLSPEKCLMLEGPALNPSSQQASYTGVGQRLSPVVLGRLHPRGTAEHEMFKGMSEPLPKLMLVLGGKNPSYSPGHSPSRCSVPRAGMELAVKPLARLLGAFPPGAGESHVSISCRARGSLMM